MTSLMRAAPRVVQHLRYDEVRAGSDPGAGALRIGTVAGDDAGHVRPVAVIVVRRRAPVDKVDERIDPLRAGDAGVRQIVVPGHDSGVDDGDARAGAVIAQLLPYRRRSD